jgi:CRISPR-associated protein Cmr1
MVTPMFLHGSNNEKLELRSPPFKWLFRYWWRATQAETGRDELYKREGALFGDTTHRSPLVVRIVGSPRLTSGQYTPLPHRAGSFKREAYLPGNQFALTLICRDFDIYQPIMRISFLLGGVGNRSRRGFGSLREQGGDVQNRDELSGHVLESLEGLTPGTFARQGEAVVSTLANPGYPVIKKIEFGQTWSDPDALLKHIGQATHQHAGRDLGGANPRQASPLHVRVHKAGDGYVPIVTQMHSTLNHHKQQAFIDTIVT